METAKHHGNVTFAVNLQHALIWVARALDYVGIDDLHHNQRVAYIVYESAKALGWTQSQQEFCFFAGLLHDCGVSQTQEHEKLVSQMQPKDADTHCQAGYQALKACELLARFSSIILFHHTEWRELKDMPIMEDERNIAALIFAADRLDFLRAKYLQDTHHDLITLYKQQMIDELNVHRGTLFCPEYVDVLSQLVKKDGFWFAMDSTHIETIPLHFEHLDWLRQDLSLPLLIQLGRFIAGIVDAKSPFTYQHSIKVAELCEFLAHKMGLNAEVGRMLYVAGLVHDIGKLRTPDEILHKRGPLSKDEYIHIKRHTVDTEVALSMVFPDSKIGEWAINHHERLNGSGYPYNKTDKELDLPSRIIAVADIFQALSQDRPYRARLSSDEIVAIMQPLVDKGEIDKDVYACLERHLQTCYALSTQATEKPVGKPIPVNA